MYLDVDFLIHGHDVLMLSDFASIRGMTLAPAPSPDLTTTPTGHMDSSTVMGHCFKSCLHIHFPPLTVS